MGVRPGRGAGEVQGLPLLVWGVALTPENCVIAHCLTMYRIYRLAYRIVLTSNAINLDAFNSSHDWLKAIR